MAETGGGGDHQDFFRRRLGRRHQPDSRNKKPGAKEAGWQRHIYSFHSFHRPTKHALMNRKTQSPAIKFIFCLPVKASVKHTDIQRRPGPTKGGLEQWSGWSLAPGLGGGVTPIPVPAVPPSRYRYSLGVISKATRPRAVPNPSQTPNPQSWNARNGTSPARACDPERARPRAQQAWTGRRMRVFQRCPACGCCCARGREAPSRGRSVGMRGPARV